MAFNLAQYNINPFNVQGENIKWLKVDGRETVTAVIGSALEVYASAIGNERVDERIIGAPTKYFAGRGAETVSEAVTEAQPTVLLYPQFVENINSDVYITAKITPTINAREIVDAEIPIESDIYASAIGSEVIEADDDLGSNIYVSADGFELVSESASLDIIDRKVCLLTTTLRPGHMIIIDAETYTVLLDGENAIEIQSGDWIDELNRDTVDISIDAASGVANLSARLIYTERYL